jgi:hypothetical protein
MKGIAELNAPITHMVLLIDADGGSANKGAPRDFQMAYIKTEAKVTRPAASQKGVMPSNAISVTRNVPPQVKPRITTMSQLLAVISVFCVNFLTFQMM